MRQGTKWLGWTFLVVALLLVMTLTLSACAKKVAPTTKPTPTPTATLAPTPTPRPTPTPTPTPTPKPVKKTLVLGVAESSPGIDTDLNSDRETWRISPQVNPSALEYRQVNPPGNPDILVPAFGDLQPDLFESWELSKDGKTLTLRLRKGIKSANGNEITTKDIFWTYQRAFALHAIQEYFLSQQAVPDLDHIKVIDDYTISLTATVPNQGLLEIMSHHYQNWVDSTEVKKHTTKEDPWALEWIKRHGSSGIGAYTVEEWKAGDRIVLKANPNYHLGKPAIEEVIFKVVPESSSRVAMLKDGTLDVAYGIEPSALESLKSVPGIKVVTYESNLQVWGILNNKMPPFDNKLVRQAMNYAIPREEIVKTAYLGYARPAKSPFPSIYPSALPPEEFPYSYDLDKAKNLLAAAGYPNGFKVELRYPAANTPLEVAATMIKTSLAKIGVDVSLTKVPVGPWAIMERDRTIQFGLWEDMPMFPDPFYITNLSYHSKGFNNPSNYGNPEVDKLIEQGRTIQDWNERVKYFYKVQKMILDDAAMLFTWEPYYAVAMRDNIKGWNWGVIQETKLERVSFTK